ncbi:hypothetical protein [Adhaeribacter swui]|nr:hypothetical protein [Adhaeribacter swui]
MQYLLTLEGGKVLVTRLLADFREIFKKRRALLTELNQLQVN